MKIVNIIKGKPAQSIIFLKRFFFPPELREIFFKMIENKKSNDHKLHMKYRGRFTSKVHKIIIKNTRIDWLMMVKKNRKL